MTRVFQVAANPKPDPTGRDSVGVQHKMNFDLHRVKPLTLLFLNGMRYPARPSVDLRPAGPSERPPRKLFINDRLQQGDGVFESGLGSR